MIGMEMSPSGRITVARVKSLLPQTVISSSSSGPRRKPVGDSYVLVARSDEKQPATKNDKHINKPTRKVDIVRLRIPLLGCWNTGALFRLFIVLGIPPLPHSARRSYHLTSAQSYLKFHLLGLYRRSSLSTFSFPAQ